MEHSVWFKRMSWNPKTEDFRQGDNVDVALRWLMNDNVALTEWGRRGVVMFN